MNILFISHLSNSVSAGPNWSVPASIQAQSKFDNVLWINITQAQMEHWTLVEGYHNLKDYGGRLSLKKLPESFLRPDVVVFEGFYAVEEVVFSYELRYKKVPYIIIPRGSLTKQALNNHSWLKKKIAHFFFFDSFVKHAKAIQFLTDKECKDSICLNKNCFIIPNGFVPPLKTKEKFSTNSIRAVFIGRMDIYHKGLDILLDSCEELQNTFRKHRFELCLYGPKNGDYEKVMNLIQVKSIGDFVKLEGEVSGKMKESVIMQSDIFILTSRFEGHPMGLIEALAYGLPSLVAKGTNMFQEVLDADAGWVCENTKESVCSALLKILNEKDLFVVKGRNAACLAAKYDWDLLAKDFHSIVLERILRRNL